MKRLFGLCIILIMLAAASGCTQPANPAPATPVPTEVVTTLAPTPEPTMPPATVVVTTAAPAGTPEPTAAITTKATPGPDATPSTKITVIHIRNNTFVPQELMVLPGTGISWLNDDKSVHSVKTLPDTGIKFMSSDLVQGASFSYTFGENEGTFGYIDPYTNATGTITVKKGASFFGAASVTQTPTPTP